VNALRHVRLEHGYVLRTYDTGRTDRDGRTNIGYRLTAPDSVVLFDDDGFRCSPLHAIDSDEALRALCGFLFLRPGDTDRDYFDGYTAEQRAFAESSDCESLAFLYSDEGPGTFDDVEPCECTDPGCPCCRGTCKEPATLTAYRVDMHDETGVAFCEGCGADALESGVFTTRDDDEGAQ